MNSGIPIFPTMVPNIVNSLWFSVDEPTNEDTELIQIESVHQNWLLTVANKITDKDFPVPIGKTATEVQEDDDEDDEEEEVNHDSDDNDSETHDEEDDDVEMEVTNTYDRDSPVSVSTR